MIRNRLKIAWAYAEKFAETQQTGILAALFAFLTIFISCLGLFGLAGYMAENRTKEIGVRKVLGATVGGIVGLLSKDFVKLVAIAFVIASPIAYYVMDRWLGGVTYRVAVEWEAIAVTGIPAVVIAVLTVSFQPVRAATANPVSSLKDE